MHGRDDAPIETTTTAGPCWRDGSASPAMTAVIVKRRMSSLRGARSATKFPPRGLGAEAERSGETEPEVATTASGAEQVCCAVEKLRQRRSRAADRRKLTVKNECGFDRRLIHSMILRACELRLKCGRGRVPPGCDFSHWMYGNDSASCDGGEGCFGLRARTPFKHELWAGELAVLRRNGALWLEAERLFDRLSKEELRCIAPCRCWIQPARHLPF